MIRVLLFIQLTLGLLTMNIQVDAQGILSDSTFYSIHAKKSLIDSAVYNRWTHVERAKITNDGMFVFYIIKNDSMGNNFTGVLTSNNVRWSMRLQNVADIEFTADSKMAAFIDRDTLFIVKLGNAYVEKIPNVNMFFIPTAGGGGWVAFRYNRLDDLVLFNIHSRERKVYSSAKGSFFSEDGRILVLQTEDSVSGTQSLDFVELKNRRVFNIWKGKGLISIQLNSSATQATLHILDSENHRKSIWFYERGKGAPYFLVNVESLGLDSSWVLNDFSKISKSGNYVSFSVRRIKQESTNLIPKSSTVNIWSYLDTKLQSIQLLDGDYAQEYQFVVDRRDRHITQLCKDNESIMSNSIDDDVYVIEHVSGDADGLELSWNSSAQRTYYIKSVKQNKNVMLSLRGMYIVTISPNGKYAIYYDPEKANYFSYEVASGIYRNITSGINVSWNSLYNEDRAAAPRGIAGWLANDTGVLIYDKFDIWIFDPSGSREPANLTNGYGLVNSIVFYLGLSTSNVKIISDSEVLLLNALNMKNKQNGFFQKKVGKKGNPTQLTMGNYIYQLVSNHYLLGSGEYPIKAKEANKYIVLRRSANESPNYFFTTNFTHFSRLSYVCPEKAYNWYRTELHSWRRKDGKLGQGILYKPEDFDSTRQYPIIFHYYEKKSFSLNEYLFPKNIVGGCNIDIPTFVSKGYLVFTPDIDYIVGDPMQGTLDAVLSAANYITQLPFIAKDRMGIGGCSFGGTQTNYIITHSSLFAAAYSASSMSDFISAYGDIPGRYRSIQSYFEKGGQGRMGVPLWEAPEMYIKNSAVFSADKVTTPLLLMHTTNDGICSFSQALEFYTSLRRLGKKVWLLEYTEGNHGIYGKAADDYAIRLSQFFDHYLKGKPAPQWMTRGVPAKEKGVNSGLDLDSSIITPGNGLFINSQHH